MDKLVNTTVFTAPLDTAELERRFLGSNNECSTHFVVVLRAENIHPFISRLFRLRNGKLTVYQQHPFQCTYPLSDIKYLIEIDQSESTEPILQPCYRLHPRLREKPLQPHPPQTDEYTHWYVRVTFVNGFETYKTYTTFKREVDAWDSMTRILRGDPVPLIGADGGMAAFNPANVQSFEVVGRA